MYERGAGGDCSARSIQRQLSSLVILSPRPATNLLTKNWRGFSGFLALEDGSK